MTYDPEWTPDQEQYYLENPDEWPGGCPETWNEPEPVEPDPDEDMLDDSWEHELDPYGEEDPDWDLPLQDAHGLTADGYALLAEMDLQGDFV